MADFNDDDGRRYGDWQKKGLRKDANTIVGIDDNNEGPWYKQNFWMVLLILVVWPVGLVLCWKSTWSLSAKIVATIYVAVCIVGMLWVYLNKIGG